MSLKESNTLLYLPETGIYPYLRSLCLIGNAVSNKVSLLHCTGQMQYCNMMSMANVEIPEEEKKKICERCTKLFCVAKQTYSFDSLELVELIPPEKIEELKELLPENFNECIDFSYKGFAVGKVAEYDLVLKTKFLNIENVTETDRKLFYRYLLNAVISAEVSDSICKSGKVSSIIAYNPYTVNQVAHYFAKKNNVPFTYITNNSFKGADFSSFLISDRLITMDIFENSKHYKKNNLIPLQPQYVRNSWDDSFFRFYGSDGHIFSNAKSNLPEDILKQLHFSKNKKTIIAFTSSNDEMIGIKLYYTAWNEKNPIKNVFDTQVEWIEFLMDYAAAHKEIQIIVRVHPREGKRQNGMPSEHLLLLQNHFRKFSDNFVIIWADDSISSYDLIELADVCLVNWSTMGQECARVGVPVLTYTMGAYYVPSESFYVADTLEDYEKKLNQFLQKEYTMDMLKDGIRYNYWRNFSMAIDCSDTVPHDFSDENCWPILSEKKAGIIKGICTGSLDIVDYNKSAWLAHLNDNSEAEETEQVLIGISAFYNKVFSHYEKHRIKIFMLKCIRKLIYIITLHRKTLNIKLKETNPYKVLMQPAEKKMSFFVAFFVRKPLFWLDDRDIIVYSYKGKLYKRYSPLLWKLGKIYEITYKNGETQ